MTLGFVGDVPLVISWDLKKGVWLKEIDGGRSEVRSWAEGLFALTAGRFYAGQRAESPRFLRRCNGQAIIEAQKLFKPRYGGGRGRSTPRARCRGVQRSEFGSPGMEFGPVHDSKSDCAEYWPPAAPPRCHGAGRDPTPRPIQFGLARDRGAIRNADWHSMDAFQVEATMICGGPERRRPKNLVADDSARAQGQTGAGSA